MGTPLRDRLARRYGWVGNPKPRWAWWIEKALLGTWRARWIFGRRAFLGPASSDQDAEA